jgi:hypothetical protein
MNRLSLFLAAADKRIANYPLFSAIERLVLSLSLRRQADHFVFRISHFASRNQPSIGVRPNEKRI